MNIARQMSRREPPRTKHAESAKFYEPVRLVELSCAMVTSAKSCERACGWLLRHRWPWVLGDICGFVYFAQRVTSGKRTGLVKIGYSNDPIRRMHDHRAEHGHLALVLVIPGSPELERELHGMFYEERDGGEWFRPSRQLSRFMAWLEKGLRL